jgi:hypothetical protein
MVSKHLLTQISSSHHHVADVGSIKSAGQVARASVAKQTGLFRYPSDLHCERTFTLISTVTFHRVYTTPNPYKGEIKVVEFPVVFERADRLPTDMLRSENSDP